MVVSKHLQSLLGGGRTAGRASGGTWTIQLAPVADVNTFASRIAIGSVSNVNGREMTLTLDPAKVADAPSGPGGRRPQPSRATNQPSPANESESKSPFRAKQADELPSSNADSNPPDSPEPQGPSVDESPFRQKGPSGSSPDDSTPG